MNWICKPFDGLTLRELYRILQLRSEVFVVEQNCPYLDTDNKDEFAYHLMGINENSILAYTRLLPAGISYGEISIGRVVVSPNARSGGTGRELMKHSIDKAQELFGKNPIRIGAQLYLKKFYESFGFSQSSDIYLEDGIQHIEMLLF
jgi:ElaA protein